ncbi:hypothetical protein D3C80_955060 [compost metagenome]
MVAKIGRKPYLSTEIVIVFFDSYSKSDSRQTIRPDYATIIERTEQSFVKSDCHYQ